RGADDETRVPTATTARVHHSARRRDGDGDVRAARRPRAAAGEVAGHRVPQQLVACQPQVELDQLVVLRFSRRPCLRWTPATLPADNGCPTLASALLRVTIAWFSDGELNETGVAITAVPTKIQSM